MSEAATDQQIAEALRELAGSPASTLIAGAGVSVPCGMPSWHEYMVELADHTADHDPSIASVMRDRIQGHQYVDAASLFDLANIPEGTRLKIKAARFADGNAAPLKPLVSLGWSSILTTNFDSMLANAWAEVHKRAPYQVELGTQDMRAARYAKSTFIARIHGRHTLPQSMVLSRENYAALESDKDYLELLYYVLTQTRCAFLGFSFTDPAVEHVLRFFEYSVGPNYPQEHLAVLADGNEALAARLLKYNVRTLTYEAGLRHEALWRGIHVAASGGTRTPPSPSAAPPRSLESAHRLLASAYVHRKVAPELAPLRDQVFKGLIVATLTEFPGLSREELTARLKSVLPLTLDEVAAVLDNPLAELVRRGFVTDSGSGLLASQGQNELETDLKILARGAIHRARVRRGERLPEQVVTTIVGALIRVVLMRGWDLGAQFAGAASATGVPFDLIRNAVEAHRGELSRHTADVIAEALHDLLNSPNTEQAEIIADLGRLSFAADVVLQHGRTALVHAETLPERIYLDASFLLPAIARGHPFYAIYVATIERWRTAAAGSALNPQLFIPEEYLEEIVHHRRLAKETVASLGLEDPKVLQKHLSFYSAHNGNVFISAYASDSAGKIAFEEWLDENAPYQSITQLKAFLSALGINPVAMRRELESIGASYSREFRALVEVLDSDERSPSRPDILVTHDAIVLAMIGRQVQRGEHVLFVTADNRLRRAANGPVLGNAGYASISGMGFVAFVDFFVGVEADSESLAKLIWGVRYVDQETDMLLHVRSYYTDLALRTYDEAMVMAMPDVLESVSRNVVAEASLRKLRLDKQEDAVATSRLLDRFEDVFYEAMAETLDRRSES